MVNKRCEERSMFWVNPNYQATWSDIFVAFLFIWKKPGK